MGEVTAHSRTPRAGLDWASYFYYDTTSPTFLRWKVERRSGRGLARVMASPGTKAGTNRDNGKAAQVSLNGVHWLVPRIVWELLNGPIPAGMVVDHEDGNPLNNLHSNLRIVTQKINSRNQKIPKSNKSGVMGVSKSSTKGGPYWVASWRNPDTSKQIQKSFPVRTLGEEEAFRLACEARKVAINELNASGAGYSERHGND